MDNVLLLLPRKPVIGHQKTLTFMREAERLLSLWGRRLDSMGSHSF